MPGPVAAFDCPSSPTLVPSISHGPNSYTPLSIRTLCRDYLWARCTLGFDTHQPTLPSAPRSQKRPIKQFRCLVHKHRIVPPPSERGDASADISRERLHVFERNQFDPSIASEPAQRFFAQFAF